MSKKHLGSGRNAAFAKPPHRPSAEPRARQGGSVVRVLTGVPQEWTGLAFASEEVSGLGVEGDCCCANAFAEQGFAAWVHFHVFVRNSPPGRKSPSFPMLHNSSGRFPVFASHSFLKRTLNEIVKGHIAQQRCPEQLSPTQEHCPSGLHLVHSVVLGWPGRARRQPALPSSRNVPPKEGGWHYLSPQAELC